MDESLQAAVAAALADGDLDTAAALVEVLRRRRTAAASVVDLTEVRARRG